VIGPPALRQHPGRRGAVSGSSPCKLAGLGRATAIACVALIHWVRDGRRRVDLGPDAERGRQPSTSVMVIAVAPDATRYATAAFVSGDLAGARNRPLSISVTLMTLAHSEDHPWPSSPHAWPLNALSLAL